MKTKGIRQRVVASANPNAPLSRGKIERMSPLDFLFWERRRVERESNQPPPPWYGKR